MAGKTKPWIPDHRVPGLQSREYGNRRTYRLRQRHRGRLYIDYLGEMPLIAAARFARELRLHRSDPARLEQIREEIRAVTQPYLIKCPKIIFGLRRAVICVRFRMLASRETHTPRASQPIRLWYSPGNV